MKQTQLITKTLVVAALVLGGSSSTYAQFGNVLNRAKNAVKREAVKQANDAQWKAKSKVYNEVNETVRGEREKGKAAAEEAASEATGVSVSEETSSPAPAQSNSAAPKKEIRKYVNDFDYKMYKPKRTDWTYESDMRDVVADLGYWLQRLRASAEKDDKSQLDIEALDRLTKGKPSFDFVDKDYTDGMISEAQLGLFKNERLVVCRAATEVRDGVELDLKWQILDSNDEEKALKKEITTELHRATMLKRYKEAATMNRYKPAISGQNAWVNNLVKENFPEWGKIVASKINTDYKVNYEAPGKPKSRYHSAVVMCQDQGYKVLHYIQLSQPYKGNGKYGDSEVRYGGMKWSEAVTLVK